MMDSPTGSSKVSLLIMAFIGTAALSSLLTVLILDRKVQVSDSPFGSMVISDCVTESEHQALATELRVAQATILEMNEQPAGLGCEETEGAGPATGADKPSANEQPAHATPEVSITSHDTGAETPVSVRSVEEVSGRVVPPSAATRLRILIRPVGGARHCYRNEHWFPQRGVSFSGDGGDWSIWAEFGKGNPDDRGCAFELMAATFDDAALARVEDYFTVGEQANKWHPMALPEPITSNRAMIRVKTRP